MKRTAALALLMAGCHPTDQGNRAADGGARLETAAVAEGLVVDPRSRTLFGAWSLDTDRACVIPGEGTEQRIGVLVDYGAGQGCAASGTVERRGPQGLDIRFGDCRLSARFDGDRIVFPPAVPAACDRLCVGRASLATLTVERQSASIAEASNLRTPSGRALCAG